MKFLHKNLPCIILITVYVLCVAAADPRGEFPLNDDWSYCRSAFTFGSGKGLKVDEWAAPSLVGQALYGGMLARFFPARFLVLRLSTLVLSCCTAMLLWGILRRIGFRNGFASIVLLAWLFNPLQFNLAFTYMTEIPFIFFIVLAVYLYVLHRRTGASWRLFLSAASLGYAFLIRQTALFFILALVCAVLVDTRIRLASRLRQCLLISGAAGIFVAGYFAWIMHRGGSTAAVHRKFVLLDDLTTRQIMGNSYGMLFYLAFMLLPVWLFLIPSLYRAARRFKVITRIGVLAAWSALVAVGLWWFPAHCLHTEYLPSTAYHARMPFLLNVLYDTGLGPITLDPDYFGLSPTPVHPRVWLAVTALVAAGVVFSGLILTFGLFRLRRLRMFQEHRPLFVFSGLTLLCVTVFETIFSHLQEGGLFDRHILIAALPFCLLLALFSGANEEGKAENRTRAAAFCVAGIAIAALGLFSVAATHDYMEWNRIRWDMGESLLKRGIDPLTIAGGFEFNAWHNYDTFLKRGNIASVHDWWYDRRDYVISMNPQEGYEVLQEKEYYSWVNRRPVALYLIRNSRFEIRDWEKSLAAAKPRG